MARGQTGGTAVRVSDEQRSVLERWVRRRMTPQRLVLRSRIVLLAADGTPKTTIAKRLGTTRRTVQLWCQRFTDGGPAALVRDAPGRGRKPRVSPGALADALRGMPDRRQSIRQLAQQLDASSSAVHRALRAERVKRQFRNKEHKE